MNPQFARATITLFFGFAALYIAWGFFVPLIIGAAIALLLHPIFDYLVVRKSWRADLSAALVTLGVTVLFILPTTLLSIRGVRFLTGRFQQWRDSPFSDAPGAAATFPGTDTSFLETITRLPLVSVILDRIAAILHMDPYEVMESAGNVAKNLGVKAADLLTKAVSSLPAAGIGLFLMVLGIYFFLADGTRIVRFFRANSFFPAEQTEEIFLRFKGLCRAVLLASLVSGLTQSAIYFIGGAIGGVGNLIVLAFSVFIASFIPVVGAAPLTFGLAIYLIFSGDRFGGFSLLIAAMIASIADNFVRPIVLRGGANLHPLIALIALFGGLQVFGFAGVFIGPIFAGMFFVFLDAYVGSRQPR